MDVLRLVMDGLTNGESAGIWVTNWGTAKTHIHPIYGKPGVRNRTEAAMRAKELHRV